MGTVVFAEEREEALGVSVLCACDDLRVRNREALLRGHELLQHQVERGQRVLRISVLERRCGCDEVIDAIGRKVKVGMDPGLADDAKPEHLHPAGVLALLPGKTLEEPRRVGVGGEPARE